MKNLLESFAILLVGVLSLLIVFLIVQYNMIEDEVVEEEVAQVLTLLRAAHALPPVVPAHQPAVLKLALASVPVGVPGDVPVAHHLLARATRALTLRETRRERVWGEPDEQFLRAVLVVPVDPDALPGGSGRGFQQRRQRPLHQPPHVHHVHLRRQLRVVAVQSHQRVRH